MTKDLATLKNIVRDREKVLLCQKCQKEAVTQYISMIGYNLYRIECHCVNCGNIWSLRFKIENGVK